MHCVVEVLYTTCFVISLKSIPVSLDFFFVFRCVQKLLCTFLYKDTASYFKSCRNEVIVFSSFLMFFSR